MEIVNENFANFVFFLRKSFRPMSKYQKLQLVISDPEKLNGIKCIEIIVYYTKICFQIDQANCI